MFQVIANVLAWFYQLTHDYAASVALMTLAIMIVLMPLTLKATKSMIQMQRLQPEMKRLQQQYKGDRQKLNEELMRFYKENNINPLGGCLPMVLQLPVFFIIYRVIRRLSTICPKPLNPLLASAKACKNYGKFWPSYLNHNSLMFKDLTKVSKMSSIGLDLSRSSVQEVRVSFGHSLPYLALVLVVAGTSYYQQRQMMARSKTQGQPINQQQVILLRIMPVFFALISLTFPSALIVYFIVSNLFRIAQQGYITRAFYRHPPAIAGGGSIDAASEEMDRNEPKRPPRSEGRNGRSRAVEPNRDPVVRKPKPVPKVTPKPKPAPNPARPSRPKPSGRVTPPKKKT